MNPATNGRVSSTQAIEYLQTLLTPQSGGVLTLDKRHINGYGIISPLPQQLLKSGPILCSSCLAKILEKVILFIVISPRNREGWGSEQIHVGALIFHRPPTIDVERFFAMFQKHQKNVVFARSCLMCYHTIC